MKENLMLLFLLLIFPLVTAEHPCQSCSRTVNDKMNIHLIPHSHDEGGWLRTVDQYYRRSGKDAGVEFILSSIVQALKRNPERRFIQVETAFLWQWWQKQGNETQKDLIDLVNNGQLEIVNGAWTMNDEATTNYQSIIDQFTYGLRILDETLGKCGRPKIGWQIDAYGHSRTHASIIKQLGFDALILAHIDYRDKANRRERKNLEFLWNTNLYKTPSNMCFDIICSRRDIITEENINQKVASFAQALDRFKEYYKTNNIMIPMGHDFAYQVAESNFYNMDRLIEGFKHHPTYNVFYSTPSCYVKAVSDEYENKKFVFEEKTGDFMPYSTDSSTYWSGYFTSRPTFKRLERVANNILQAAKQLVTFAKIENIDREEFIAPLKEAAAMIQGHNAIAGTERQYIANDYVRLVTKGIEKAEAAAANIVGNLLKRSTNIRVDLKLSTCIMSNVSICNESTQAKFVVIVYNPLSHVVSHHVRLPVKDGSFRVFGPDGELDTDVFESISNFEYVKENMKPSPKELVFLARDLPPLGMKMYYVKKLLNKTISEYHTLENGTMYFGNEVNGFAIESTSGRLTSAKICGIDLNLTQEFLYYTSSPQSSPAGAYIFKPDEITPNPLTTSPIKIKYKKGKLADEVLQTYATNEITQIIRVYKSEEHPYIEFDWLVGNLDTKKTGKEIATSFAMKNFCNDGTFTTDSNGREHIARDLSKRDGYSYKVEDSSVSGNYYPVTSDISINDKNRKITAIIMNDRAQGGSVSGLKDGTVELMIHRRLVTDDGIGIHEVLNEKEYNKGLYARGQHYFTFGYKDLHIRNAKSTVASARDIIQRKRLAPWVLIGEAHNDNFNSMNKISRWLNFRYDSLKVPLPDNVHILTLEPWKDDTFLLRLEHILEKGDDHDLSNTVEINLEDIFINYKITDIRETTLGANQWLDGYKKEPQFTWNGIYTFKKAEKAKRFITSLKPMQIRTYVIRLTKKD